MLLFSGKHDRPAGVGQRTWREISKTGMFTVGVAWDRWFKMRHFAADATSRYGYAPRTPAYRRRKERRGVPGFLAMVFQGHTRAAVSSPQIPRAFPTRATITLSAPPYIQMRPDPRRRKAPNLGEELTRTTAEEIAALEKVFTETTEPLIAAHLERMIATGR
jgi:hypothetical protein